MSRLAAALDAGLVEWPEGRLLVFGQPDPGDLFLFPRETTQFVISNYLQNRQMAQAGFDVTLAPEGAFSSAVLFLPRSRDAARAQLARLRKLTVGPIVVDGAKTDGVESLYKALRQDGSAELTAPLSKSHGKIFVVNGGEFDGWAQDQREVEGFVTRAGVFSAERIDPGSRLLADALPKDLKGRVGDFGAGWGYLSSKLVENEAITAIDLIESDAVALECARINVPDTRARFLWADAVTFHADEPYDVVISNPPFHTGRKGDPSLGQGFIRNAARNLAPKGRLWMVANRHLPYESILKSCFREVEEVGRDPAYKLFHASRPKQDPDKASGRG